MVRWVWPWTHTNSDLFDLQCFSRQICTFLAHFVRFNACTVPFAIYPMTFFIASSCCPSLDDSRAFLRSSNFFEPAKSAESSAVPELLSSLITRLWRISLQKGRFFSLTQKAWAANSYSPSLLFAKSFSLGGTVFNSSAHAMSPKSAAVTKQLKN